LGYAATTLGKKMADLIIPLRKKKKGGFDAYWQTGEEKKTSRCADGREFFPVELTMIK